MVRGHHLLRSWSSIRSRIKSTFMRCVQECTCVIFYEHPTPILYIWSITKLFRKEWLIGHLLAYRIWQIHWVNAITCDIACLNFMKKAILLEFLFKFPYRYLILYQVVSNFILFLFPLLYILYTSFAGVYSDPYVHPLVRSFVRPSVLPNL